MTSASTSLDEGAGAWSLSKLRTPQRKWIHNLTVGRKDAADMPYTTQVRKYRDFVCQYMAYMATEYAKYGTPIDPGKIPSMDRWIELGRQLRDISMLRLSRLGIRSQDGSRTICRDSTTSDSKTDTRDMSERIEFKTQALRPASFFWVYYTCLCVCAYAHVGVRMAEYDTEADAEGAGPLVSS